MRFCFVAVSGRLPLWLEELSRDYSKKIAHWVPSEMMVVKSPSFERESKEVKKRVESKAVSKLIKDDDFLLLCDERGQRYSSLIFAKKLESVLNTSKKRLVVLIGGAYGVEKEISDRADMKLCLSEFTLNHHLAFAMIHEQIYRALTILKGVPYHN